MQLFDEYSWVIVPIILAYILGILVGILLGSKLERKRMSSKEK